MNCGKYENIGYRKKLRIYHFTNNMRVKHIFPFNVGGFIFAQNDFN